MHRPLSWTTSALIVGCTLALASQSVDQALGQTLASAQSPYRRLAKGVIKVVEPKIEEEETFSGPRPMVELLTYDLKWTPKTLAPTETLESMAQDVIYRRQVWGLEFGFKPLRMIDAVVHGRTQKVYYLLYYVKNNGQHLNPSPVEDDNGNVTYEPKPVQHSIRFFPNFVLQAHDVRQAYMDEVLPSVMRRIQQREDPNRAFLNTVSIGAVDVGVSDGTQDSRVWGIATWTGVDPKSDFFSVYVSGLTNAYRWVDPPEAYSAGDEPMTGRRFTRKTLQLNFWRAGDSIDATESEIRYGVPNQNEVPENRLMNDVLKLYELPERVDYRWVYR